MSARILPCGDEAILVELDDLDAVLGLHAALAADPPAGVVELVPAARTVLVAFDPARTTAEALGEALRTARPAARGAAGEREGAAGAGPARERGPLVEIAVAYDGADLAEVAEVAGCSPEEVVRRHLAGEYVAAFCGFAPGFAYLDGLDPALHVPRRDTPRTRVPAGAVAVAGRWTAAYPRESPGGWRLIGRTDAALWDAAREPPALLPPGTRVRFVEAA